MQITDYQPTIYNSVLNDNSKGFGNFKSLDKLSYTEGYVKIGMEYRPDLVADYYLNDSSLGWLITYFNNFTNGIEDYTLGKKLKIPSV